MNERSALARVIAVVVIVAALVAGGVADRRPRSTRATPSPPVTDAGNGTAAPALHGPTAADVALLAPSAAPIDALSSTWYCAGAPSGSARTGRSTLLLANRATSPSRVQLTVFGNGVANVRRSVQVPGSSAVDIALASVIQAPATAAVIEATGGGLSVTERIVTDTGSVATPCTTHASSQWYFADGSSARGAALTLTLFNPFPDLVTADVSVIRADGYQQPPALSGIPVPAGSVVRLPISDIQKRQTTLGTLVTTRTGRVIAALTQTYDGSGPTGTNGGPPSGISVTLGAPRALTSFVLPVGLLTKGLGTRITIANPGSVDSTVRLDITLTDPVLNGQPTPIVVHVPATSAVQLGPNVTSVVELKPNALRQIPSGSPAVPFTVRGTVTSGGPVVAEATLDGADPYSGHGSATMQAVPAAATEWVFAGGLASPLADALTVVSPGALASFTLVMIDRGSAVPLSGGRSLRSPKGGVATVNLRTLLKGHPNAVVLVRSDVPVIAARTQSGRGNRGLSLQAGIAVSGTLHLLG